MRLTHENILFSFFFFFARKPIVVICFLSRSHTQQLVQHIGCTMEIYRAGFWFNRIILCTYHASYLLLSQPGSCLTVHVPYGAVCTRKCLCRYEPIHSQQPVNVFFLLKQNKTHFCWFLFLWQINKMIQNYNELKTATASTNGL